MRFRDRGNRARIPARSAHARLVRLGIALVLIIAAIKVAADPSTWVWMFPRERNNDSAAPSLADVSYDIAIEDDLRPDEFRSAPIRSLSDESNDDSSNAIVAPQLLSAVEDDTLTLRSADREAYFAVLGKLSALDEREILDFGDSGTTFPAVMTAPNEYRGRVVVIEGTARRILEIPAGANSAGFQHLYELWVFTPDSGDNPWRVITTELPAGLPRGVLDPGVSLKIVGVFFKRQGYETQGHALHVAPLLLAKTAHAIRPATKVITEFDPLPWLIGIATAVAVFGAFLFYRFRREDQAFERTTLNRLAKADESELQAIGGVDANDPTEFFRRLAQQDALDTSDHE
jgi:hypothetical protein